MLTKGYTMLGYLFEKVAATVKETYNAVEATVEYVYEDISSIPDHIIKGWEEGVFTPTSKPEETQTKSSDDL